MLALVQRVRRARVVVDDKAVGSIDRGLLVLVCAEHGDSEVQADKLLAKLLKLRIFNDMQGKMNLSVQDVGGAVLAVSNFTLYADCQKGRRPSFVSAARPEVAEPLYVEFLNRLRALGLPVQAGRFGADMQVELTNDGPVTLLIDTQSP